MVVPLLHQELSSMTKLVNFKLIIVGKSMAGKVDIGKPCEKKNEQKISHKLL